jgi:tetraacyldisaccharide 4'-kinase
MDFPADKPLRPSWLTVPASRIYGFFAEFHHRQFDKRAARIKRVSVPVISVGNLTVGGTGKTPCVANLVSIVWEILRRRSIPGVPAILTRGYGRQVKAMRRLGPESAEGVDWREVGDEPLMLHRLLPEIPIIVDRDRQRGGDVAIHDSGSPVLLLDDGFQYRALHKDFEIVLLDGEKPLGNGHLLPAGPMREPVSAIRRANAVVGIGAAASGMEAAKELADKYDKPFYEASLRPGKPLKLSAGESNTPPKKVVLVSGIARDERFYHSALEAGFQPCEHCRFRDHHPFSQTDVAHVQDVARKAGAEAILTTAKDAVRLASLTFDLPVWILPVEFCWKKPEEITRLLERVLIPGGSGDPPRRGQ